MAIDPYSLCPGGTGKKLKFCCHDLLNELDKIDRMLQGGQQQACLDYVAQLDAKHPGRACLQTTHSMLLHNLGQDAEARRVAEATLEAQPGNPVALAAKALALMEEEGGAAAAVRTIHQAVAASDELPRRVFDTLELIAQGLLVDGRPMAALAHFLFMAALDPQHQPTAEAVMRINMAHQVPAPVKDVVFHFEPAPANAAWKADYDSAAKLVAQLKWIEALDRLSELAQRVPDAPLVLLALGRLRAYLADNEGAADALHHLATLAVPLDEAVEAEELAQLLDERATQATIDEILASYSIGDFDEVADKLGRSPQVVRAQAEQVDWGDRDDPPPRAVFTLLDRPLPENAEGLTLETAPELLATLLLFGRQTDREPRLGILVPRPRLAQAREVLTPIVGDLFGEAASEEVVGGHAAESWGLSGRLYLPAPITREAAARLAKEHQRRMLVERWPRAAHPALNGQTPEQAARDPGQQVAVLAIVDLLEQELERWGHFDELRARLNLPQPRPLDPRSAAINKLPLVRLRRLDVAKLSDDELRAAYFRALTTSMHVATRRLGHELLSRPSAVTDDDAASVHGMLAMLEPESEEALAHLSEARRLREASGKSTASVDLQELSLRIERGEPDEVARLARRIQTVHRNEPGVPEEMLRILYEAGIVDERGRVRARPAEAADELAPVGHDEPGKIWTPESEAGAKKSSLWIPGG